MSLNYRNYDGDKIKLLMNRNYDRTIFSILRDEQDLERLFLTLLNNEKFRYLIESRLDVDLDDQLALRNAVLNFELNNDNQDISINIMDESGNLTIPIFENGKPFGCKILQTSEIVNMHDVRENHFEREFDDILNDLKKTYPNWNDDEFKEKALSMINVALITN